MTAHWIEQVFGIPRLVLVFEIAVRALLGATVLFCPTPVWPEHVIIDRAIRYKYNYPYMENESISARQLSMLIIVFTLLTFIVTQFLLCCFRKRTSWTVDACHYFLAVSLAILSLLALTIPLKVLVARPRPDFLQRCYPNGLPEVWTRNPVCTEPFSSSKISDGLQSFPSGHSAAAWSCCWLCFLYMRESLRRASAKPSRRVPKSIPFVIALFISVFAASISCSRLWDFRHHPEDVLAGGIMGVCVGHLCFYLYYPNDDSRRASESSNDGIGDDSFRLENQKLLI